LFFAGLMMNVTPTSTRVVDIQQLSTSETCAPEHPSESELGSAQNPRAVAQSKQPPEPAGGCIPAPRATDHSTCT
jgi:hypothetical protein